MMDTDQTLKIRHYAKSALNGFDTLDIQTAVENAKSDLDAILRTLGENDALGVLLVEPVEGIGDDPRPVSQRNVID